MAMATTSDSGIRLESPDHSAAIADLQDVIVDCRQQEGDEPSPECTKRPARAFDYVELPVGVAVSTPCSSSGSGLQRLWEGGLFDVSEHTDVTLHTACCPWHTFGTNMERSGFGTSWAQGGIFFLLAIGAVCFYVIFACTGSPWYFYGTGTLVLLIAIYAGHYRARMRRRFNIIGSEGDDTVSTIDDHLYHLMCGCCSLCQEARTLKHNNVHNGVWHGRGDILVIGSQVVFSPNGATDLALVGMRRPPSWRKTTTTTTTTMTTFKVQVPAETVALESGGNHSWTGPVSPTQQQLPLLTR